MLAMLSNAVWRICLVALPSMPTPVMREVPLDAAVKTHMVFVQGFPGMITTIQLPDAFEAVNVLCGECIDMDATSEEGQATKEPPRASDAKQRPTAGDARNWIIEKHPRERSLHVRPAQLPSKTNPISAFATNVFVTLDGGHAINISLSLYSPGPGAQPSTGKSGPDAVVTLSLPGPEKLAGKLLAAQIKLKEAHDKDVDDAAHRLLLERLSGEVQCRRTAWGRPHRADKTVVRIEQTCVSRSASPTFWLVFVVENRGDVPLRLADANLEPDTGAPAASAVFDDAFAASAGHLFDRSELQFGQLARGVVSATLKPGAPWPERWRLHVMPASEDRQPVCIAPVTF